MVTKIPTIGKLVDRTTEGVGVEGGGKREAWCGMRGAIRGYRVYFCLCGRYEQPNTTPHCRTKTSFPNLFPGTEICLTYCVCLGQMRMQPAINGIRPFIQA